MEQENEQIELKKSTSELKEAVISIAAILNKHKKGELIFGIKNSGEIIGQKVSEATLREISQIIASGLEPRIYPEIKKETICGKDCVKVSFEGHEQPYFAYDRAYMRVADEDRQLSAKEIENIILRKTAAKWDSKHSDISLDDIDEETLKSFIGEANQAQRIRFSYTSKKQALEKLGLIKDSNILNAAKILFSSKEPVEVQAAVFAGRDKTTFIDIQQYKGNLFQLLRLSEIYVKEHINWKANLIDRKRQEIPEIPLRAITEALVNSFCHRDYIAPESNKIAIYKDRVEIWNPGDFPEGYKPQDFIRKELPSILRNPLIANILYLSADIEKWGSGLKRINRECNANGIKTDFEIMKYGFAVRFKRQKNGKESTIPKTTPKTTPKISETILQIIMHNKGITKEGIAKAVGLTTEGVKYHIQQLRKENRISWEGPAKSGHWVITNCPEKQDKGVEKWSEKWSEREKQIINLIAQNPKIGRVELSNLLDINPSAVQKQLNKLKERGILKRAGPDKGGHWEIIK